MPRRGHPELTNVGAWIRLKIRPPAQPTVLLSGANPPAEPPLPQMEFRAVPTDPRPRFYYLDEETPDGVVTLTWNADEPEQLIAELRVGAVGRHVPPEAVERFWATVRALVRPLSPVEVEGSDPPPPAPRPGG